MRNHLEARQATALRRTSLAQVPGFGLLRKRVLLA